jgi:hypothetical protein
MKQRLITVFALSLCISVSVLASETTVNYQTKSPSSPVVLGTNQLPGNFGKLGTTYTIGKESPLNFTLMSAEYRVGRFIGEDMESQIGFYPGKEEKLLIINYTVQNPSPRDARLWYNTFKFAAVSGDDKNFLKLNKPFIGGNKTYQEVNLKPGQKVVQSAVFAVPSEGETPKSPVIRYDLTGKVKKLSAEVSDDGYTPKPSLALPLGSYGQFPAFDFKVISFAAFTESIRDMVPESGNEQWVLKIGTKGQVVRPSHLWYNGFKVTIKTTDGDLITPAQNSRLIRNGSSSTFDGPVPVGEEQSFRVILDLPKGSKPSEVRIRWVDSDKEYRNYVIKIADSTKS